MPKRFSKIISRVTSQAKMFFRGLTSYRVLRQKNRGNRPIKTATGDQHATSQTLEGLRAVSRDLVRNNAFVANIIKILQRYIVDESFKIKPLTGDSELNRIYSDYITQQASAENFSLSGKIDLIDFLQFAISELLTAGDLFAIKTKTGHLYFNEADRCQAPTSLKNSSETGITFSKSTGAPLSYSFTKNAKSRLGTAKEFYSVKAQHVIHIANRLRLTHSRGIPGITHILPAANALDNYLKNESKAAEINSRAGLKITTDKDAPHVPREVEQFVDEMGNYDLPPADDYSSFYDPDNHFTAVLNPGEDIKMITADRPGGNFEPYTRHLMKIISSAMGYPLEVTLQDFERSSFSASQMAYDQINSTHKYWQRILQKFITNWYNWQITRGIAQGKLPIAPNTFKMQIFWPIWQPPDKLKVIKAHALQMQLGVKSRHDVMREMGQDPAETTAEILEDSINKTIIRTAQEKGIELELENALESELANEQ